MTIASETIEFRRLLGSAMAQALPPAAMARVNVGGVISAAGPALAAGWPGGELARQAIIGAACGDSPGAIMVTNLKALADTPPPRSAGPVAGPTPPERRATITTPQPLPECGRCGQPFRRSERRAECPMCGGPLHLVELDIQAALAVAQ